MMVLNIKQTVSKKDWVALVDNFLPSIVADSYSFTEAMRILGYLVNLANSEMESTDPQIDFIPDGVKPSPSGLGYKPTFKFPEMPVVQCTV